jgi:uncharacterized protein YbjT (DUF2867 family)
MTQTILVAGATGMLGRQIALQLTHQPDIRLRLLVRDTANKNLSLLTSKGAELIEGDLINKSSLDRATSGVDVIISAVQGGPEIIIDGQIALAEAGKRNGAQRILPSDFALDLFKATPGEHMMFDMKAKADAHIATIGLEQINILQGAFMNMFLPGGGAVNYDAGTISFFGDGNQLIELTTVEDTARMTARVATDIHVPPGKFAFSGDRMSFRQAGDIIAKATGKPLQPVSLGTVDELRKMMPNAAPQKQVMLAYLLYMTNGQTALSDLQNDRYADIPLQSFADFAALKIKASAQT